MFQTNHFFYYYLVRPLKLNLILHFPPSFLVISLIWSFSKENEFLINLFHIIPNCDLNDK